MKLPIEITPNPLVTSTIELRYTSLIPSNTLFPTVYKAFMEDLPNFEPSNLPPEIKSSNPHFKYAPDYVLSNENYKLSFSNSVLTFEHVSEYQFWKNYFPFVSKCFNTFFKIVQTEFIERIGVRYASVLDKTESASQVLVSVPSVTLQNYNQKFEHHRTIIKVDNINLLLQIFDKAKAVKNEQPISGVYIDIDAYFDEKIAPNETVLNTIDRLHFEQKKLFFSLLKEEYIETLNPKY